MTNTVKEPKVIRTGLIIVGIVFCFLTAICSNVLACPGCNSCSGWTTWSQVYDCEIGLGCNCQHMKLYVLSWGTTGTCCLGWSCNMSNYITQPVSRVYLCSGQSCSGPAGCSTPSEPDYIVEGDVPTVWECLAGCCVDPPCSAANCEECKNCSCQSRCDPNQCQTCDGGQCKTCGETGKSCCNGTCYDPINEICCNGHICDKRKCEYCDPVTNTCKYACDPEDCEDCNAHTRTCQCKCDLHSECCVSGTCEKIGYCYITSKCESEETTCEGLSQSSCSGSTEKTNLSGKVDYSCKGGSCCWPSNNLVCAEIHPCYWDPQDLLCKCSSGTTGSESGNNCCHNKLGDYPCGGS